MKRFLSVMLLIAAGVGCSYGQDKPQYSVSLIPDTLLKEVNSVVREENEILTIKNPGKGKCEVRRVVTILNEKDEDELSFQAYVDKFQKIDDIEINLYDAGGKYIRRYKRKDLEKVASDDGESLVNDDKILYGSFRADKFPLTIEVNYTINYEGILEYPDFYPQTTSQSIQQSSYTVTVPKSNKLRFKNYKCDIKPTIKEEADVITYKWSVKDVFPYRREPGMAKTDNPRVMVSPTLFEMDNYAGDMSTWDNFGKWMINLIKQTNRLSEDRAAYYRDMVKDVTTDREKVEILYKHLQRNYRYVGIQLGIGGFKPFPVDFVEKKKFGDCKALSNFMYAMLQAVGIKSHYAIINSAYNLQPVDKDFPQSAFNHVILCVPQGKDSIWLECTSRSQAFASLGSSTENRNAFLITETGGVIVPTPRSQASDNAMSCYSFVDLKEDGSGKASFEMKHSGEFTDEANFILQTEDQYRKNYLINYKGFKQPDALKISKKDAVKDAYTLRLDLDFEKIPDFSAGSKHFLNGRLYKFWTQALPKSDNRKTDYYLHYPLTQSDTTVYQLPEGYIADNLPKPVTIKYALGTYSASYSFDATKRQVISTCSLQLDKHIIPAAIYQDAAKFFSDVIKDQQQKIVVKKE